MGNASCGGPGGAAGGDVRFCASDLAALRSGVADHHTDFCRGHRCNCQRPGQEPLPLAAVASRSAYATAGADELAAASACASAAAQTAAQPPAAARDGCDLSALTLKPSDSYGRRGSKDSLSTCTGALSIETCSIRWSATSTDHGGSYADLLGSTGATTARGASNGNTSAPAAAPAGTLAPLSGPLGQLGASRERGVVLSVEASAGGDSDGELDEAPKQVVRRRKGAVCSESPPRDTVFTAPNYRKAPEVRAKLRQALVDCCLFQASSTQERDAILDAVSVLTVPAGRQVLRQGDIGDALYIVISGTADCYLESPGTSPAKQFVQEREAGSIFGELSIMWNVPRALSVFARDQCVLGRLERQAYQNLVVRSQIRARERREECLRNVKLLEMLGDEQIARLADTLTLRVYEAGSDIICQGEEGREFFIVQSGECAATVQMFNEVQEHRRYRSGDLFGEVALLKHAPRAATVTACTRVEVLSLCRERFERMLGPLSLLQQNSYLFDPRKLIADFYRPGTEYGPRGSLDQLGIAPYQASTHWFAVFRPTSRDAIAKMLGGLAVGKGLNVKGKSAKKNRLSGFVPFLQISDNAHKERIEKLPEDSLVRVFYKTQVAREHARTVLMAAKQKLDRARRAGGRGSYPDMSLDDRYAPSAHGLVVPGPLLYEVYITRPDLSPVVDWETGRNSEPGYMDMNLHAVCERSEPQIVLYQHDEGEAMNPRGLLIAYAEKSVKPVVSDFDAFLVGSKGMCYESLPEDQACRMAWTLDRVADILQTPSEESWTSRWFEVLKTAVKPESRNRLKYGFGDPTSIRLIGDVVSQTSPCGAVRHGAECFNFNFPLELDDEYLVVWEGFTDKPWNYMSELELRSFLIDRANGGYCFPLNPVWAVRDPGWYDVLDALRTRPANQANLECWYPASCGILGRVDDIHARHREGFRTRDSTTASYSLGASELKVGSTQTFSAAFG